MKNILMIICIFFCSTALKAQNEGTVHLNLYGSYAFQDKIHTNGAYIQVNEGVEYGSGIEYFVLDNKSFELKYLRLGTQFSAHTDPGGLKYNSSNGSLNFIMFGGNNYFGKKTDAKILPFAGLSVGLGIVAANDTRAKFAWDGQLGVRIKASSAVAFKLQAYVQSMISTFGSDYWTDPVSGVVFATPNLCALFQVGVGGAICFNITDL
jgi:hypothetical protein